MKIQATAQVHITIEMTAGVWGKDCTIDQLYAQARAEAIDKLRNAMHNNTFRIIGEPRVSGVITSQE